MRITNFQVKNNEEIVFASVDIDVQNEKKNVHIKCNFPSLQIKTLDAFLPLVVLEAAEKGEDIIVDGAVSSDLLFKLNDFLLPVLCNAFNTKPIKVKANKTIKQKSVVNNAHSPFNCTCKKDVVKFSSASSSFNVCVNYPFDQSLFKNCDVTYKFLKELSAGLFLGEKLDSVLIKMPEQCGHLKYITNNFYDYIPLFTHSFSLNYCQFYIDCKKDEVRACGGRSIEIGPLVHKVQNDKCRVESEIKFDGITKTLYFEANSNISEYMVKDRCDAFIVVLLAFALRNGFNIKSKVPASTQLLKKLKQFLIPTLACRLKRYNFIDVDVPEINSPFKKLYGGFGTGFSGGVDSMYTLAKNQLYPKEHRFTHLAVFNAGVFECKDPNKIYTEALNNVSKFANGLNMQTVGISSNIDDIIRTPYHNECTIRLCACALMLGGLLNNYVVSSSKSFNYLGFSEQYCDSYEVLLMYTFSTNYITFHSCGEEYNRLQKVKFLSEQPDVFCDNLHPCVHNPIFGQENCNRCPKCIRMLYTAGKLNKLDKFSKAFDVDFYVQNKQEIDAKIVSSSLANSFDEELVDQDLRQNLDPDLRSRVEGLAAIKKIIKNNRQELIDKGKAGGIIVDKYIYK